MQDIGHMITVSILHTTKEKKTLMCWSVYTCSNTDNNATCPNECNNYGYCSKLECMDNTTSKIYDKTVIGCSNTVRNILGRDIFSW